ncbi:hypothetical protein BDW71DRAFT_212540 [Aspergillus fruticulosus]
MPSLAEQASVSVGTLEIPPSSLLLPSTLVETYTITQLHTVALNRSFPTTYQTTITDGQADRLLGTRVLNPEQTSLRAWLCPFLLDCGDISTSSALWVKSWIRGEAQNRVDSIRLRLPDLAAELIRWALAAAPVPAMWAGRGLLMERWDAVFLQRRSPCSRRYKYTRLSWPTLGMQRPLSDLDPDLLCIPIPLL